MIREGDKCVEAECEVASQCPDQGTNFECDAGKCKCQDSYELKDNKCVGMFPFNRSNLLLSP